MSKSSRDYVVLINSVLAALATAFLAGYLSDVPREAAFMIGIFVLAALLWVTEALPLFATALLVIGLEIVLLANPGNWTGFGFESDTSPSMKQILHAAADPVLVLFFGGFLLAQAAVKEGVDKAMSSLLLRPFGSKPLWIMLGLMLVTALFSMWMSNTATTAMMITLVVPMLAQMPGKDPFRKALVLCVPFAANIGGMGTPIASPPNAVAVGFLQKANLQVGFLEWMLLASPLVLALLLFTWFLLWKIFAPVDRNLRIELTSHAVTPRGWFVVSVFVLTAFLWMTDRWHGYPAAAVALLPAVALTASGILNRNDLNSLEWNILILIAGGIALGAGIQMTGLDQIIVNWLPLSGGGVMLLLVILVLATIVFGTFMSNTAAANLILPIGISSAAFLDHGDGVIKQVAIGIALAASASMALPISTPPNAISYAHGEVSTRDMAIAGSIIGALAAVLIILFSGPVMRLWGLSN